MYMKGYIYIATCEDYENLYKIGILFDNVDLHLIELKIENDTQSIFEYTLLYEMNNPDTCYEQLKNIYLYKKEKEGILYKSLNIEKIEKFIIEYCRETNISNKTSFENLKNNFSKKNRRILYYLKEGDKIKHTIQSVSQKYIREGYFSEKNKGIICNNCFYNSIKEFVTNHYEINNLTPKYTGWKDVLYKDSDLKWKRLNLKPKIF